jgi:phage gp16-like protein
MSQQYPVKFKSSDQARRDIQLIHVARSQVGMDDETYRNLLKDRFSVDSSKNLDWKQREQLLKHFKTLGFKVRSSGKSAKTGKMVSANKAGASRPLADDPESKKIRFLWLLLHELGAVKNPSETALAAYVKRIAKVDALQWLNGDQATTMIETLKKWAMRALPLKVQALSEQATAAIQSGALKLSDPDLIHLQITVKHAQDRGTYEPMQLAYALLTMTINGNKS